MVFAVPSVQPTNRVEGEIPSDASVPSQLLEPVAGDVEMDSEQLQKKGGGKVSDLHSVSVGVVLTTALQRRRQKSESKKLSRSKRFAARRWSSDNVDDSESL